MSKDPADRPEQGGKRKRIKAWVLTTKRGKFRVAVPTLKDAKLHAYNDPIHEGVVVIGRKARGQTP